MATYILRRVVQLFRQEFGLDQPVPVQYIRFISKALHGDFGQSIRYREPVLQLFLERLPATLELSLVSLALAILVGIPIGVLAAVKHNTWIDNFLRAVSLLGQAIPSFYLGLMLILLIAVPWRFLPTGGQGTWRHLILPSITLAAYLVAIMARFSRGAVLDVMHQDYVRTARAKGVGEARVLWVHVLKNAMIPIITIIGLRFGAILSGAVVIETIFAWPGIGRLMVQAISTRDFPIVQATVMIVALLFVTVNLLVDLAYAWFDPRIKFS
jgi:peptide/nickel transport system permease protein